ncbi:unnamed protein product [Phytomonas sp. EM1]|nr:unnamed protein product [Phytomonas sp. EM1]|eukprot:CCW63873.1 unnamed protein product [Phytomonas sp. isolate EM1]
MSRSGGYLPMIKDTRSGKPSQLNYSRIQSVDYKSNTFLNSFPNVDGATIDEETSEDDFRKMSLNHIEDEFENEDVDIFSDVLISLSWLSEVLFHTKPHQRHASAQFARPNASRLADHIQSVWVWRALMVFSWLAAIFVNWVGVFAHMSLSPVLVEAAVITARFIIYSSESNFWLPLSHSGGDGGGEVASGGISYGGGGGAAQDSAASTLSTRRFKGVGGMTIPSTASAPFPSAKFNGFNVISFSLRIGRTTRFSYHTFFTNATFFYEMGVYFFAAFFLLDSLFLQRAVLGLFISNTMQWANFSNVMALSAAVVVLTTLLFLRPSTEVSLRQLAYLRQCNYAQHAYFSYAFAISLTSLLSNGLLFVGQRARIVEAAIDFVQILQRVQSLVFNYGVVKSPSRAAARGQSWFNFNFVLFLASWYTIVMCEWSFDIQLFAVFFFFLVAPKIISRSIWSSRQNCNILGVTSDLMVYLSTILWLRVMVPFNEIQFLSSMMRTALILLLMVCQRSEKLHHNLPSEFYMCLCTLLMGLECYYFPRNKYNDQNRTDALGQKRGLIPQNFKMYSIQILSSYNVSWAYGPFLDENIIAFGTVCLYALANRKNDPGKGRKDRQQRVESPQTSVQTDEIGLKTLVEKFNSFVFSSRAGRTRKSTPYATSVPEVPSQIPSRMYHAGVNRRKNVVLTASPSKGVEAKVSLSTSPISPNGTGSRMRRGAKPDDDSFARTYNLLSEAESSGEIHIKEASPITEAVDNTADGTAAKLIDNTSLESHLELESFEIPNSGRPCSATEVVSVSEPLTLVTSENASEASTNIEGADSNGSVGIIVTTEALAISQKIFSREEKKSHHGESESKPYHCPHGATSASSLKTRQSDPMSSGNVPSTNLKEALSCDSDSGTLAEYDKKMDEEPRSTERGHGRNDSLQKSSGTDETTTLEDKLSSLHPRLKTMEWIEPHEENNENLADQTVEIKSPIERTLRKDVNSKFTLEPLGRPLSRVPSSKSVEFSQPSNHSQNNVNDHATKNAKEFTKKNKEPHFSAVEDGGDRLGMRGGKPTAAVDPRPSQPLPLKTRKEAERRKGDLLAEKPPRETERKPLPSAKAKAKLELSPARSSEPVERKKGAPPPPSQAARVAPNSRIPQPVSEWFTQPPKSVWGVSPAAPLPFSLSNEGDSPPSLGVRSALAEMTSSSIFPGHAMEGNRSTPQGIPFFSSFAGARSGGKPATAGGMSSHVPLSFPDPPPQATVQSSPLPWEESGNLCVGFSEGMSKEEEPNLNSMNQGTFVKAQQPIPFHSEQPTCAMSGPSEPELNLSFDNEEGLAELLSAVARMENKDSFDAKEEFSNVDSLPFFTGTIYPFTMESNAPEVQSPVGAVAMPDADVALKGSEPPTGLSPDDGLPVQGEWSVVNSETIRPEPGIAGSAEESLPARHPNSYGCAGNLQASSNLAASLYEPSQLNPHFGVSTCFGIYPSTEELGRGCSPGVHPGGVEMSTPLSFSPQVSSEMAQRDALGAQGGSFNRHPQSARPVIGRVGAKTTQESMLTAIPLPNLFISNSQYANVLAQQQQQQQQRMQHLQQQSSLRPATSLKQQEMTPVQLISAQPEQFTAIPLPDGRMGLVRLIHPLPTRCYPDSMEMSRNASGVPLVSSSSHVNMTPVPMFVNTPVMHQALSQNRLH